MTPGTRATVAAGAHSSLDARAADPLVAALARRAPSPGCRPTVTDVLRALPEAACAAIDVDAAGVMRDVDGRHVLERSDGAHAARAEPLCLLEEALQEGPGVDALADGAIVVASHLGADGRWADFEGLAAYLQLGTVVAVPLRGRERTWGALELYRREPLPWSADDEQVARTLARAAVVYLDGASDPAGGGPAPGTDPCPAADRPALPDEELLEAAWSRLWPDGRP